LSKDIEKPVLVKNKDLKKYWD